MRHRLFIHGVALSALVAGGVLAGCTPASNTGDEVANAGTNNAAPAGGENAATTGTTGGAVTPSKEVLGTAGFVEVADCTAIVGWAWNSKKPGEPVEVTLLENNKQIATATADVFRKDLQQAGVGEGNHSFRIPTPPALKDGKPHKLQVRVPSLKAVLKGSPKTITCTDTPAATNTAIPPGPTKK